MVTRAKGDLLLQGNCPRCAEAMTFPVVAKVYRGGSASQAGAQPIVLFCTSEGEYEGRPPGRKGCGAYWSLVLADEG